MSGQDSRWWVLSNGAPVVLSCYSLCRHGALSYAYKGANGAVSTARLWSCRFLSSFGAVAESSRTPMMRPDPPPNFWEREAVETVPRQQDALPRVNSTSHLHGYENSGAFQELNEFWDRPSVPMGPASDSKVIRPSGGKPDWYRMISDNGPPRHDREGTEDDEVSKVYGDFTVTDRGLERSSARAVNVRGAMLLRDLNYSDYLQLDRILSAQQTQSGKFDKEVHDEHLFIVIHQTYELWFKQILYEVDSVMDIFVTSGGCPRSEQLLLCNKRFGRVVKILQTLVQQFDVLETMDAQAFQDFRDFLAPASGFQSKQFRVLENTLGLAFDQRIQHSGCPYFQHLRKEDQAEALQRQKSVSLLDHVATLLEKLIQSVEVDGFDFASYMRSAIERAAVHDGDAIRHFQSRISGEKVRSQLADLDKKREAHLRLFSSDEHGKLLEKGIRKLSFRATMSAVFVESFQHQPRMQLVHGLLTRLVEVDELLAQWRHRHSLIVLRMLGTKDGTGGSSGHAYLVQVLNKSRIFLDLCHSKHYLLPQHSLPSLPSAVQTCLGMVT